MNKKFVYQVGDNKKVIIYSVRPSVSWNNNNRGKNT